MPPQKTAKPAMLLEGDRFVDSVEAANLLGAAVATLNFWRVVGRGPRFYRHGRSVRYLLSDLNAWGTENCVETRRPA